MMAATGRPQSNLRDDIRAALKKAGLSRIEKDVLEKCVALSSTLQMSPSAMATCWEAFSLTKDVTELTSHTFQAYKNQVYKHSDHTPPSNSTDGAVQSRNVKRQASLVTPPTTKRQATQGSSSSVDSVAISNSSSPVAASRPVAPLPKYEERSKAGQIVASFNPKEWPAITARTSASSQDCIIQTDDFTDFNVTETYRHMFTAIQDRSHALENQLQRMGKHLIDKLGISDGENGIAPLEQVNVPRQELVCCIGRICNEAHEGKLNSASIVLEGSSASCGGVRTEVDLSHLKSSNMGYSLFPGQIVAIEGMNPTGRKLMAQRIFEGAVSGPNTSSVCQLRQFHHEVQDGSPLRVLTASGPFTTSDSMSYQPLIDLLHVIMEQTPDAVILTGPFVDMRQDSIKSGRPMIEFEEDDGTTTELVVSYEAFFANKVTSVVEEAFAVDEALKTQFIFVPSLDDATAKWVFPQPPLRDRYTTPVTLNIPGAVESGSMGLGSINKPNKPPRVHCLSNPCTFKINEVVFGVTSTDVLFHISAEETNANLEPGSRLRRIAQHMLQQRSYYPLFPPPPSLSMNLDLKHMDKWQMPCTPDVLIVPSRLTSFATSIMENTVFVNPGHVTRGTTGGTYATMEVRPIRRDSLDESGGDDVQLQHGVPERINVEIKKI